MVNLNRLIALHGEAKTLEIELELLGDTKERRRLLDEAADTWVEALLAEWPRILNEIEALRHGLLIANGRARELIRERGLLIAALRNCSTDEGPDQHHLDCARELIADIESEEEEVGVGETAPTQPDRYEIPAFLRKGKD